MKHFICALIGLVGLYGVSQTNQCACCSTSYDDFDFWKGSWVVTNTTGAIVGYSNIEEIQDNCIILENWKAANGNYSGTSYNTYNQSTQQWEQLWIDNSGQILKLKGNRVDNKMILESEVTKDENGNSVLQRITWTKNVDGSVRQLWETITNDTTTTVAFDGLYKKKDQ